MCQLKHYKDGVLKANCTPTDRRYYTYDQYLQFIRNTNEKLFQDIILMLYVFSCRLYGLRKYKNQIKGGEQIVKELQDRDKSNAREKDED